MTKTRKPNGYWKKEKNALAEALKAMEKHNWTTLPSSIILAKYGYSSLSSAISTYHRGIQIFRTTLGQTNHKKLYGYWQQEENTIAEARQIMEKHEWNTLPSKNELEKHGYNSFSIAITKYHGGIQQFRTTLGLTNTTKPQGYWKSLDNTITEAKQIMKEQGWESLPSAVELEKHGYNSFSIAITKYHGGIHNLRKLLTEHQTGKTQKQQLEQLLDEYIAA